MNVRILIACAVLVSSLLPLATTFADWPEYRGNRQRTAFQNQPITSKFWKPAWQENGLSEPQPAWPAPARGSLWQKLNHIEARVVDDRGYPPVIALDENGNAHVLIASSTMDQLVSLDPVSGKVNWEFQVEAPVRYAPSTLNGIAFMGADDGLVRAIRIANGKEVWRTQVGPQLPWIVGNGRLISPHPIRTSVAVENGKVFAHAGLFPSQGVYSVALDAADGQLIWRRKLDQSPQGYLMSTRQHRVYVPSGRSVPYAIDSQSGKRLYDLPSSGGSFCMLTAEAFFTGTGNDGKVQSFASKNRARMLSFSGKDISAGLGKVWTANGSRITCHEMALVMDGKKDSMLWSADSRFHQGLIVSGNENRTVLFAANGNQIQVMNAGTGKSIGQLSVPNANEKIIHLAVSAATERQPETLIATTDQGSIYGWTGSKENDGTTWPKTESKAKRPSLATSESFLAWEKIHPQLQTQKGFALVVNDPDASLTSELVDRTDFHVVMVVENSKDARRTRLHFAKRGEYGKRVSVFHCPEERKMPFSNELFNLVVAGSESDRNQSELTALLWPGSGVLYEHGKGITIRPSQKGVGKWRHQYANPGNGSDSGDQIVGTAAAFRLQWFGGVGPSRMPDRHLRGPAPLCVGSAMIMQADGGLIGVDPANGTERWQLELPPGTTRYVTPFDGGYVCLDESGSRVFAATPKQVWNIDAWSGKILNRIPIPDSYSSMRFGYVCEDRGALYSSLMKTTAPRIETERKLQYQYVSKDYESNRPLVCSRILLRNQIDHPDSSWRYAGKGPIPNGSIALSENGKRLVFIEGRSEKCIADETDRIVASTINEKAFLVCLDTETGKPLWETPVQFPKAANVLYAQISDKMIVLSTSESAAGKAVYHLKVLSLQKGEEIWAAKHVHLKNGLGHGEQVHHPLILKKNDGKKILVAEPYFYELANGKRTVPDGAQMDWGFRRPGHSCGTLSGAGNCLFFRADNPTVLNLNHPKGGTFTKLAPSRPGCWINMIPVGGRLLIPEASASCVCKYSLQTSMSFVPVQANHLESQMPVLKDVGPADKLKEP